MMAEIIDWRQVATEAINSHGALQDQAELEVLLSILHNHLPVQVIEIGCWAGGLTWALSQLPEVRTVVTVDRYFQSPLEWQPNPSNSPVVMVQGDSNDTYTRDKVTVALGEDLADVLVIDGGHEYQVCMRDWELYTPLVADDGLIVVHDTQGYPGRPDIQVPDVWVKIRRQHRTLELVSRPGGPHGTGIVWK